MGLLQSVNYYAITPASTNSDVQANSRVLLSSKGTDEACEPYQDITKFRDR